MTLKLFQYCLYIDYYSDNINYETVIGYISVTVLINNWYSNLYSWYDRHQLHSVYRTPHKHDAERIQTWLCKSLRRPLLTKSNASSFLPRQFKIKPFIAKVSNIGSKMMSSVSIDDNTFALGNISYLLWLYFLQYVSKQ